MLPFVGTDAAVCGRGRISSSERNGPYITWGEKGQEGNRGKRKKKQRPGGREGKEKASEKAGRTQDAREEPAS